MCVCLNAHTHTHTSVKLSRSDFAIRRSNEIHDIGNKAIVKLPQMELACLKHLANVELQLEIVSMGILYLHLQVFSS